MVFPDMLINVRRLRFFQRVPQFTLSMKMLVHPLYYCNYAGKRVLQKVSNTAHYGFRYNLMQCARVNSEFNL